MTDIVKVKTGSPAEERGAYSRLIAVDNLIFVSNTAGRNPRTKLIPEDPAEQTLQVLSNIDAALAAVGSSIEDVIAARVFVQFPQDIDAVMEAYAGKMRGINPTLTLTSPPLGMAEFKVEIEVTAYRGATQANVKEITITL
ncbi:Rid family hydrolase [Sphingobium sp. BS19]|uniref:Rid family hydrolase n=1 Tax=Sphingobium sp. BS19 TaxID=3018973 RepID=UPI0022ED9991|nr:Rid family hydrolase [Sphingobium sp. BS19]GLI98480.1 hypothetical protein Sbs19_22980 [Sphingobium sp. BS19]|tara:strand:+ start:40252 stop:40674 length:423 start_codon:yes stop_codon:yes gene_type:complete